MHRKARKFPPGKRDGLHTSTTESKRDDEKKKDYIAKHVT